MGFQDPCLNLFMINRIYWLVLNSAALPSVLDWLSAIESEKYNVFRFAKRKREWLLGRWSAKTLLTKTYLHTRITHLSDLSILNDLKSAPYASYAGQRLDGSLSITHRDHLAVAAFCAEPTLSVGIDLEKIERKTQGFMEDYFTENEVSQVLALPQEEQALAASLLWSGREALLKAEGIGLRVDTRDFQLQIPAVDVPRDRWQPLFIQQSPLQSGWYQVFWQLMDQYVLSLAIRQKNQESFVSPDLFEQITD